MIPISTFVVVHAQSSHSLATSLRAQVPNGQVVRIPGMSQAIVVGADLSGNPVVWASDELGAFAGLGYAQASTRLWQMDELRRSAYGTLSAMLGAGPDNAVMNQDILERVLGIQQAAAARYSDASPRTRADLSAYAAGVNVVIAGQITSRSLPDEFSILGYQPERWQPQDSMAIGMAVAASLDIGVWSSKIASTALAASVGSEVSAALAPDPRGVTMFDASGHLTPLSAYTAASPFALAGIHPAPFAASTASVASAAPTTGTVPSTTAGLSATSSASLQQLRGNLASGFSIASPLATLANALGGHESNNFAIAGAHTVTGGAILEGDPHLLIATPGTADLVTLAADRGYGGSAGWQVQGLSIPGFAAFISMHTRAGVGFVLTYLEADATTLYLETPCATRGATDATQYLGRCVASVTQQETIHVAGGAPVTITVTTTPHGPLLNTAFPALDAFGKVALKQALADPHWTVDGMFELFAAHDWTSARRAMSHISIGLNWLYGDASGNIGYQASGLIPQVSPAAAFGPVAGDDPANEWQGFVAFSDLPVAYDPPSGLLATANNPIVPANYAPHGNPVYISNYADENWRVARIYQQLAMLTAHGQRVIPGAAEQVALDVASPVGQELVSQVAAAIQRAGLPADDPDAGASLADLVAWAGNTSTIGATSIANSASMASATSTPGEAEGMVTADSRGALLYEVFAAEATRDLAEGVMGSDLYDGVYAASINYTVQLQALAQQVVTPTAPFWGAMSAADAGSARDQALARILSETDALLRTTLGTDRSAWTWGALHTLTYNHPLAIGMDPTGQVYAKYAIGTFPRGGDTTTINTGGWNTGIAGLPSVDAVAATDAVGATAASSASAQGALLEAAQFALRQDAGPVGRTVWALGTSRTSNPSYSAILFTGANGDPDSAHWADQAARWRAGVYIALAF